MLSDNLLCERFVGYINSRIELGNLEIDRLSNEPDMQKLALMYRDNAQKNLQFFQEECKGNILNAFNALSNEGFLELITTAATHAYLPIYKNSPLAVNAQIETGLIQHIRLFDRSPEGFWLPECGYYPTLEELLKRNNVKWTSLAAHSLLLSEDKPQRGNYAPVKCPNGLWCFARDNNLTSLVWSATDGYPADPCYREFYRDIGYDLDINYVRPFIHEPDVRVFTGFKYWAVTGKTAQKVPYSPEVAAEKTKEHAEDFLKNVRNRTLSLEASLDCDPVYTLSFDAELFGHWWFEGVMWLEHVITSTAKQKDIELITPSVYIAEGNPVQTMTPAFSSWGEGGCSQVWVDTASNSTFVKHTIKSIERMSEIAVKFPNQKSLKQRFLNQAARETLLLMSSDWPFIMHNHTSEEYAKKRLTGHIQNLNLVYDNMTKNAVNTEWLVKAEKRNNIFPQIDYNMFNPEHLKKDSPVFTTDFTSEQK